MNLKDKPSPSFLQWKNIIKIPNSMGFPKYCKISLIGPPFATGKSVGFPGT